MSYENIQEIITNDMPYSNIKSNTHVFVKVVDGVQPSQPEELKNTERGNQIWNLLLSCWSREPASRPSAQQVFESVRLKLYQ
jgi:hypothetical protein